MKTKFDFQKHDPKIVAFLCVGLILVFVALIMITGCTTTKDISRQETVQETKSASTTQEEKKVETQTDTHYSSEFDIVEEEDVDTVVKVIPVVNGVAGDPVDVTVNIHRTKKTSGNVQAQQQEDKKANTATSSSAQQDSKSKSNNVDKHVERTGIPVLLSLL